MATIVLGFAGAIALGPPGLLLGKAIGGIVDREVLFKPKGREGPRLSELAVQTSSYGTQIPRIFGTMRVAGSVIWATDLVEHRSRSGGKGRPTVTNYSYTASFAVALSARPIRAVRRIWADGRLLRGAAGDFKERTGFRFHPGDERQEPDPLIAAAEGAHAPAHRGIAYAVFEDLELGAFGNRIPSLSFEIEADPEPVAPAAIARELGGMAADAPAPLLAGFSAHGASVGAVIETLAGASGGWFVDEGPTIALCSGSGSGPAPLLQDAGTSARDGHPARAVRHIAADDAAPQVLSLSYHDPDRDYQTGVQRAARPGAGTREARLELPAVIDAATARAVAEGALARSELERERRTLALGWDALAIRPGARVRIEGAPGLWRVDRWTLEAMVLALECVPIAPATLPAPASGGRALPDPDRAAGTTILHVFELPPLDDSLAARPSLAVAAAGTAGGWRTAALIASTDGGVRWEPAGATALPAVLGTVLAPPGAADAALEDRGNSIDVTLAHAGMALADADWPELERGANLALVGDELIQFGRADPTGGSRWRLHQLWRGRRGTEAATASHLAGERFVLIEPEGIRLLDLDASPGSEVRVVAQGTGDPVEGIEAVAPVTGFSVAPPSPVHLRTAPLPDGGAQVQWVRRSRNGWRWEDGIDAPLAEEIERYRIVIATEGVPDRVIETSEPTTALLPAEVGAGCRITVRQIGARALSATAVLDLPSSGESL